ncbi:hypothetical protein [Actinosynnema sp. NPDC023587]|uniref:hypothetical protein n=1 Tax=Actinosynnema sp. NPDC023587 TaxID=3154695 RepID=UPI0033F20870
MPTFATPNPVTASLTVAGTEIRVVAGERADTIVSVEPVDSTSKTDVQVAEGIKVDSAGGDITARAADCPIRVGHVTRGPADVDADSTKGFVRNSLPVRENPTDTVEVRAHTRRDDIAIHPAA